VLVDSLEHDDAEVFDIIELEKRRQRDSIILIASEVPPLCTFNEGRISRRMPSWKPTVLCSKTNTLKAIRVHGTPSICAFMRCRYYGGNEYIDKVERLCQRRALEAFDLDPAKWGVNVQSLSGAPANMHVYGGLLKPHDRIMGLDLPHGGHLSHGYQTEARKISHVSVYYETMPYRVNEETGIIDYDTLERNARLFRPKLLVAGASAYPRNMDYAKFREIADACNAHLMVDMAHISGMVAAGLLPTPFEHAHVVTTTTHKSLRGPRGAMIFFRRGVRSIDKRGTSINYDLEERINFSVFPGHQGGPHNNVIAALAVALKQAKTPEFVQYQTQVLANCQALARSLQELGYDLVTDGTDTHLILMDLRSKGIDGARVERLLELVNIVVNKNTIPSDTSAIIPYGLRVGTPAMTSRGLTTHDMPAIAEFIDRGVRLAKFFNDERCKGRRLRDFRTALTEEALPELVELRDHVIDFARQYPTAGYEQHTMKYGDQSHTHYY
jgi:glycine hydroxymethyltransferase